ncbi:MAG: YidH family protein [Blastococcus sp.]
MTTGSEADPDRTQSEVRNISGEPDGDAVPATGSPPEPGSDPGAAAGADPDYRFTLANERTFLAWFRTALALIAGGVAVVQLVPEFAFPGARHALGTLLTVAGGTLSRAAVRRWQRVQWAMRHDQDLPPTRIPTLLGVTLAALTAFVVVLLLISWLRA